MNRFSAFVKKEFFHIFRDPRTLIVLFGIPLVQMLLFGFVITNEIKDTNIAVLDYSKDEVSKKITNKIISSGYFTLDSYLTNDKQIEKIFKRGNVKEVIIFEPHFAEKLERTGKASIQLIGDASDANTANLIVNYTNGIIMDYQRKATVTSNLPLQINQQVRMFYNPELKGVYLFVPGIMALILILVSALLTSISIVREKELGTMEVLLISPLRPFQIIIGKVMPYIALAFIDAVIIIVLGYLVFGLPVKGSIALLLAESLLFIALSLSLGIFISTSTNSQQVAMMLSMMALMLPTILLSGFIFPIENMPWPLQWLSVIIPPKYYITIIKDIMLKGNGIGYVWKETLAMIGMTAFFILLSIKKFTIRLEK
jgi:ABC-2 type transport system permease protein